MTANKNLTVGYCYLTNQMFRHCLHAHFKCLVFADVEFANVCLKFLSMNFGESDWSLSVLCRLLINYL